MDTTLAFNKLVSAIQMMTKHSQQDWSDIEVKEKHVRQVVHEVSAMIETAKSEYLRAVTISTGRVLINVTHHWSPERVLSVNKRFTAICGELEDERIWKRLTRQQRKFVADAYEISKGSK